MHVGAYVGAILAVLATSFYGGMRYGKTRCEAAHNIERLEEVERDREAQDRIAELETEQQRLSRELEERSYAEPVVVSRCVGPSRVRRLNERR